MAKKFLQKIILNIWFLKLYTFQQFCNDHKFFQSIQPKNINFVTTASQIIQINKPKIITILLSDKKTVKLYNFTFAPD